MSSNPPPRTASSPWAPRRLLLISRPRSDASGCEFGAGRRRRHHTGRVVALGWSLRLLTHRVAPDRRRPARAMAGIAKPRATRQPAGHSAAALANGALIIAALNGSWHLLKI